MRTKRTERKLRFILPALAAALVAPLPQVAQAQSRPAAVAQAPLQREIGQRAGELASFYAARGNAPLWLDAAGHPTEAVATLLGYLRTAQADGVDPQAFKLDQVVKLVDKANRGNKTNQAQAEIELSRLLVAYVQAIRNAPHQEMIYETTALRPAAPTTRAVLEDAGKAASLQTYISTMGWMHPLYAPLRAAAADPRYTAAQQELIRTNLDRVRAIPNIQSGRHILVDAAGARLWMYEDGKVVDTMKVVVGKPDLPTPMMAGYIRRAIVNPYWQVPPDLVQNTIAANVLDKGVKYLRNGGYQVLATWDDNAPLLDPKKVDWNAVHAGLTQVHVRQLPGGENFMGKVKFEFPNAQGIYLHDTPSKDLMAKDERQFSSGCVRLEDAQRLGQWLMNAPLPTSRTPERTVALPDLVPVFITYLTAVPQDGGQIAFQRDPYKRDARVQLAVADTGQASRP